MDDLDRSALIDYFKERAGAPNKAMRAYWAGRIDGHCLQNAIDIGELTLLAHQEGFLLDWPSALQVVTSA